MTHKTFVRLCLLPLAVVVTAFFLLPMVRLVITGATGDLGLIAYAAILFEPRYRVTLINTVLLAAATTSATLAISDYSCNGIVFPAGPFLWQCSPFRWRFPASSSAS
jgi:ABC-type spermidine/putrescine transport system permease subunit I